MRHRILILVAALTQCIVGCGSEDAPCGPPSSASNRFDVLPHAGNQLEVGRAFRQCEVCLAPAGVQRALDDVVRPLSPPFADASADRDAFASTALAATLTRLVWPHITRASHRALAELTGEHLDERWMPGLALATESMAVKDRYAAFAPEEVAIYHRAQGDLTRHVEWASRSGDLRPCCASKGTWFVLRDAEGAALTARVDSIESFFLDADIDVSHTFNQARLDPDSMVAVSIAWRELGPLAYLLADERGDIPNPIRFEFGVHDADFTRSLYAADLGGFERLGALHVETFVVHTMRPPFGNADSEPWVSHVASLNPAPLASAWESVQSFEAEPFERARPSSTASQPGRFDPAFRIDTSPVVIRQRGQGYEGEVEVSLVNTPGPVGTLRARTRLDPNGPSTRWTCER